MSRVSLIYVVWYSSRLSDVKLAIFELGLKLDVCFSNVVVVDNSGSIEMDCPEESIHCVEGTNTFWEFSGYFEGLEYLSTITNPYDVALVLNDSYGKNWDLFWGTKMLMKRMLRDAVEKSAVCFCQDIFRHKVNITQVERTVNSRIFCLPVSSVSTFGSFLRSLCEAKFFDLNERLHNIYADHNNIVERWINMSHKRWTASVLQSVKFRIAIEHSIIFLNSVPGQSLRLYPKSPIGSYTLSLIGKIFGERR